MPRIPTSYLRHARAVNPLLPLLLQTCRTIPSAHNELRWLREHVHARLAAKFGRSKDVPKQLRVRCLVRLVRQRARGVPLQYLLGSQPFGELDIKCGKGVLIPRQCTEAYTETLARLIAMQIRQMPNPPRRVRIVDFCTGTGCIPLLLLAILSKTLAPTTYLNVVGVDISPLALALAKRNYTHNRSQYGNTRHHEVDFIYADLLDPTSTMNGEADEYDLQDEDEAYTVVVSNPPYISKAGFEQQTERSVRNYEPQLALVPRSCDPSSLDKLENRGFPEDIFYTAIAERAEKLAARVMLLEVAGTEQAVRVAKMVMQKEGAYWQKCQIWGDEPDAGIGEVEDVRPGEKMEMERLGFGYRGAGMARSVYFVRDH